MQHGMPGLHYCYGSDSHSCHGWNAFSQGNCRKGKPENTAHSSENFVSVSSKDCSYHSSTKRRRSSSTASLPSGGPRAVEQPPIVSLLPFKNSFTICRVLSCDCTLHKTADQQKPLHSCVVLLGSHTSVAAASLSAAARSALCGAWSACAVEDRKLGRATAGAQQ